KLCVHFYRRPSVAVILGARSSEDPQVRRRIRRETGGKLAAVAGAKACPIAYIEDPGITHIARDIGQNPGGDGEIGLRSSTSVGHRNHQSQRSTEVLVAENDFAPPR